MLHVHCCKGLAVICVRYRAAGIKGKGNALSYFPLCEPLSVWPFQVHLHKRVQCLGKMDAFRWFRVKLHCMLLHICHKSVKHTVSTHLAG